MRDGLSILDKSRRSVRGGHGRRVREVLGLSPTVLWELLRLVSERDRGRCFRSWSGW